MASLILREREQKLVDGIIRVGAFSAGREAQGSALDRHHHIRRDDVETILLDADAVFGGNNGHCRSAGQNLRQMAFIIGLQMLDQNKSHSRLGGERCQKSETCFESARGCADAYYRETNRTFISFVAARIAGQRVSLLNDCIVKRILGVSNRGGSNFEGSYCTIKLRAAIRDRIANFNAVDGPEKTVNGVHRFPGLFDGPLRVLRLSECSLISGRINKCKSKLKFGFQELDHAAL